MSTWTTVESATTWDNKRVRVGDRVRVQSEYHNGDFDFTPGLEFEITAIKHLFDGTFGTRTFLGYEQFGTLWAIIPAKCCTKVLQNKGAA